MPGDEHGTAGLGGSVDADSVGSWLREAVDISEPIAPPQPSLVPGDILADRFLIERRIASGGMGTIHRATDLWTQAAVAIKVLTSQHGDAQRFAQEARVLAGLSHPSIVRYIGHGTTVHGVPFLAMEWLAGEDLADRLLRSRMTVEECLMLIRRACEGLAAAHARGIVHRDLKPSNLFLVDREPASLKVLDFGIARQSDDTGTLTQPGTVLGTVGYMSPEQARGTREVDARADVFALGCVLFECLTGRAAFVGPSPLAVLAKVLCDDPPRAAQFRPGLDEAIELLLARMLAKDADDRPQDARAILRALDELGRDADCTLPPSSPDTGLTIAEQKIVSVILGGRRGGPVQHAHTVSMARQPTEPSDGELARIRELTRRFGSEPVALRDGGLLVVLSAHGAATDLASQAARYALQLGCIKPELALVVATGRAETTGRVPVGAAIDRAAGLLAGSNNRATGIAIDQLTAGLLDPSFEVRREGVPLVLVGERIDPESTRLLMGKPTPFVGREKELALLELTLRECCDESVARAVLVSGPPGQGKSRLRHELVARVRALGNNARIVIARADPVGAGSAFLLVRQLVRQTIGLRDGERASELQPRLRERVAAVCEGVDAARIADFLGELVDVPSTDDPSPELRAARNDPNLMSAWLSRSFGEWLAAECRLKPLLLVLEDLHWGDLPSVTYLGDALRALRDKPLMVLALARPEVHDAFPELWPYAEKQELALGRLTPRAAERLVQAALGEELGASTVSRIVERADGNAFYLEELIRHLAGVDSESLPETVLALIQSRLERLDPEARRIVRAGGVFGRVLWPGGIAALLGTDASAIDVDRQLQLLAVGEVLVPSPDSRFRGEGEYVFRHGLLREAAYAMLTDGDRVTGHRLAGEWLERAGEGDAVTLADHFELGGAMQRALPWLVLAAKRALDGGALAAAMRFADRALACGPNQLQRGVLESVRASALLARGELAGSVAAGRQALDLLPVASLEWMLCAANLFSSGAYLGDASVTAPVLQAILSAPGAPEPSGPYSWIVFSTCAGLTAMGATAQARTVLERAEALRTGSSRDDPTFVAGLCLARSSLALSTGALASALTNVTEARELADRVAHPTYRIVSRLLLAAAYMELGSAQRVRSTVREMRSLCESEHHQFFSDRSAVLWGSMSLNAGRVQQAIEVLTPLVDRTDRQLASAASARLAHALVAAGDLPGARRYAGAALEIGANFPTHRSTALGAMALVASQHCRYEEALTYAERGLGASANGGWLLDGSILRLIRTEALHELHRDTEAHAALREARDRIAIIAATLEEAELRECYAKDIAANARTLRLASEWLGEDRP